MSNKRYQHRHTDWKYIERGERLVQNALNGCYVDCFDLAACFEYGFPIENIRPLLESDDVNLVRLGVMAISETPRDVLKKMPEDFKDVITRQMNYFRDEMLTYYGVEIVGENNNQTTESKS